MSDLAAKSAPPTVTANNIMEQARRWLEGVETRLSRWPRPAFLMVATLGALALAFLFFSPRLFLFKHADGTTFQWSRGLTYLSQCAEPFRNDVEPAMRWRLLPPIVAHALGLRGFQPLALPWIGMFVLVGGCVRWGEAWLKTRTSAFAFATLVATTSAVLVPLHWAGINDAWVWFGLFAVVFSRSRVPVWIACLLCPWIDERFIIGLGLAVWSRFRLGNAKSFPREMILTGLWLIPYVAIRGYVSLHGGDNTSAAFVRYLVDELRAMLPWAPLGWWMGLRAAWALGGVALVAAKEERRLILDLAIVGATIAVSTFVAHDLSRSIAIVLPWLVVGAFCLYRRSPEWTPLVLVGIAAVNLLLPAAHIVESAVDVISPLPLELFRILN